MPTWLVESYWPTSAEAPDAAAERIRHLTADGVRLVGVVHVPGDEMALWRFEAPTAAAVEDVCRRASLGYERVVEVFDLHEPELATS